jgi:hypothetical protein
MGLPDADFPDLAVAAVRGEAVGVASLERSGFALEEGSVGPCAAVCVAVDADVAG